MAMARASEASICGLLVNFSMCMTIICTCSLLAAPVPTTSAELDLEGAEKVLKLIDMLEDLDDVQNVYSNADIPESVAAQLG